MLKKARNEALAAHELARQRMKERTTQKFSPFKKGEKVWLDSKNLKLNYENKKIAPRREGPFKITEVLGPLTYRLELPKTWKIHPIFHATLLSPYRENSVHGPNFPEPSPDLIDQEEEYEVEAILNHRQYRGKRQYLIKWKGYPSSENTWEPQTNLERSEQLLKEYKRTHKL